MNNVELLLKAIKDQAELFLKLNGEFAPFASFIQANAKITNVGAYSESTSSAEMYNILLEDAYEKLEDEDIRLYGIALNGVDNGQDVLVIEFLLSPEKIYEQIYPYSIVDGEVMFGDMR